MKRYTWRTGVWRPSPVAPPTSPTLNNYADAWQLAGLGQALLHSLLVTLGSVLFLVVLSSMAAYPLARSTRSWSKGAFLLFMTGLLLPFQLALIPLYQTMRDLGLLGNPLALVIFYIGLQMPFSVFLYTGFPRALDRGYEEAALTDGCGPLRALFHVVLPLMRPVTGTVVILNVIFVWNDFLTPLLYLSGTDRQTVPVALFGFVGQYDSRWPMVFAALVIGIATGTPAGVGPLHHGDRVVVEVERIGRLEVGVDGSRATPYDERPGRRTAP
ncbi:ABC transporter permease subunit [Streptomyces sp. N2-109]|uniref:ABC transporter permease subunit n=1 Tax=Streptomyces gossypii TaxID=2883101 RepID=A0ABT2JUI9_9ACTN|nr:ABC transporter permease subunit [Streptomyces gossypii]MCT2591547.1 ABC transporter permease subunit [Streptomyces gossypii]